jgi:arylsulfatase A-like enzyme
MKKFSFWTLLFFLLLHSTGFSQSNQTTKPNVVFILADDLGYGEVGCFGQTKIKTPNIDELAKEGMRFTELYAGAPVCAPSRCDFLTGMHSGHAHVRNNFGTPGYKENVNENGNYPLDSNAYTIGNLFKDDGYATAAIGKWGLGNYDNSGNPLIHGFDIFYGYYDQRHAHNYYTTHLYDDAAHDTLNNPVINVHPKFDSTSKASRDPKDYIGNEYSIDRMTAQAISFIDKNHAQPFFLYLPYTLPHAVLQAPQSYIDEYIKDLHEQPKWSVTNNGIPTYYPLSTYAAQVSYLDTQVKIVLDELHKYDLDNNTIVIFTSDNGAMDGEKLRSAFFNSCAGLRGFKSDLYEGGIREPFVIKWPGHIPQNTVNTDPAILYDMMATFADILKVKVPKNDGVSMLPVITAATGKYKQHKYFYWEFPGKGRQVAVRIGNWKGIRTGLLQNPNAPWQVYDIATDSAEAQDVAAQHPELVRKFKKIAHKAHTTPVKKEWDIYSSADPNAKQPKEAD